MPRKELSAPTINFCVGLPTSEISALANICDFTDLVGAELVNRGGEVAWCLQSYFIFRNNSNLSVLCTNELIENGINFIHSHRLLELRGSSSRFIVCMRADYPRRRWAHYHVVQNKNQQSDHASFVPHWPQPGLMKRDPNRQGVCRVGYAGQLYGNLAGNVDSWKREFDACGLEFVPLPSSQWHDLRSIDVLIGIRSFDSKPHNNKPASKLINAWHAGIPFIGGYESAFMQIGHPGEDYLLAGTLHEAIAAVIRLRDNPQLYSRIVENGARVGIQYTERKIYEIWENTIFGPVMHRYEQWKSLPNFERVRFNTCLTLGLLEHMSKQVIKRMSRSFSL